MAIGKDSNGHGPSNLLQPPNASIAGGKSGSTPFPLCGLGWDGRSSTVFTRQEKIIDLTRKVLMVITVPMIIISLALAFYSIGVWSQRFAGRLNRLV
jgi:hypothetical protein